MKMLLAATTALISVATALAGPLPAREPEFGYQGMDANQVFMCQYGGINLSVYQSYNLQNGNIFYGWQEIAVPVWGKGETVSAIEIANKGVSWHSYFESSKFWVGLYESGRNHPRKGIAGAYEKVPYSGCLTSIPISPVELQKGKRYWVVETIPYRNMCSSAVTNAYSPFCVSRISGVMSWFFRTTKTNGTLERYGSSVYSYKKNHHHKGPWQPITGGTPYVKLISNEAPRKSAARFNGFSLNEEAIPFGHVESTNPVRIPSHTAGSRGPP